MKQDGFIRIETRVGQPKWRDFDRALHRMLFGEPLAEVPHYSTKVADARKLLDRVREAGNTKADALLLDYFAHHNVGHLLEEQAAGAICDAVLESLGLTTPEVKA